MVDSYRVPRAAGQGGCSGGRKSPVSPEGSAGNQSDPNRIANRPVVDLHVYDWHAHLGACKSADQSAGPRRKGVARFLWLHPASCSPPRTPGASLNRPPSPLTPVAERGGASACQREAAHFAG